MIEIRHLKKAFPDVTPLKDVSVTINDGDVISVIGPSGTGKSTLIRCINLLEKPTSGEIIIDGTAITDEDCDISSVRKKVGMVFQSFNLFGHLTVVENVMKPPIDLLGLGRQAAYDKAMDLLRSVGLEEKAMKYPDMLSGGQKQRVAIARTLSMDPEVILFDEPTSALDPTMVGEVQSVIRELAKTGKTMIIVTHEMKFAREIATRTFYMDQGGIYEDGTPEQIFEHPQKDLTRRFIRRLKVFSAEIESRSFDFPEVVSGIEQYGYKNLIPPKIIYRLQTVFEELVQQILLPKLSDPKIAFSAEYDENSESAAVTVRYNGEKFEPKDSDNTLSWRLVERMAQGFAYAQTDTAPYSNRIDFTV